MNDLGLNLDGPKPLKGVLNVLGSGCGCTPRRADNSQLS